MFSPNVKEHSKMKNPDKDKNKIQRVTEIYVAVFPVRFNGDQMAEVILAGFKKDPNWPNMSQVRATVETVVNAVPDLVTLCDEIVDEQQEIESYRLLKFDKDGIHILHPDDFRSRGDFQTFEQSFMSVGWGMC
jgi:type IV secretory pathway TrbF-like protein